jgi:uncharacterized protein (DUF1330 family)
MPAYLIADITVTDPAEYEQYRKLVPASLASYGGEFVVRGGQHEVLEGDWRPNRVVVIRFPSLAQARAWHTSSEYAPALAIRQRAALTNSVIVEGI